MNVSIVQAGELFILQTEDQAVIHFTFTLEDAKQAVRALAEAVAHASKEIPRPPLGPKEWSPRGRNGVIPEA